MSLLSAITTAVLRTRIGRIRAMLADQARAQRAQFEQLMATGNRSAYARQYGIRANTKYEDFTTRVPIVEYEQLWPYIEQAMAGEPSVLWPGRADMFSRSSGTTQSRSKYIPVTPESLAKCHYRGGVDMITLFLTNHPGTRVLHGHSLSVGGSLGENPYRTKGKSNVGDVSALIMANLPAWAQRMRSPSLDIALMPQWEQKLEAIAQQARHRDITSLTGVPTWMLLICQRVMALAGTDDLRQVWPNLEVFIHGAVSFAPYREIFSGLVKSGAPLEFLEIYNASEGCFGMQDGRTQAREGEMALMCDYGIFYEFVPVSAYREGRMETAVPLWLIEPGQEYAIVITTNGGLWRYVMGDTVRFTGTAPYRFVISGRTRHFINTFGEEVIVENADAALTAACRATGAQVRQYTVAPVYMGNGAQACHEWIVEFDKAPDSRETFATELDTHLRQINSDYDAKREADLALHPPRLTVVPEGTFYKWLASLGKLGGQHKVPRLANNREYADGILGVLDTETRRV